MAKELSSLELKYYILKYYRIERQMPICCTECKCFGTYIADVIAADDKEVIEVEIKTSLSDFNADFDKKQAKHAAYLDSTLHVTGSKDSVLKPNQHYQVPNRFFYAAGPQVAKEILPKLTGLPYGLIIVDPTNSNWALNSSVKIVKQASKINQTYPSAIRKAALARMSSEIINLYESLLGL